MADQSPGSELCSSQLFGWTRLPHPFDIFSITSSSSRLEFDSKDERIQMATNRYFNESTGYLNGKKIGWITITILRCDDIQSKNNLSTNVKNLTISGIRTYSSMHSINSVNIISRRSWQLRSAHLTKHISPSDCLISFENHLVSIKKRLYYIIRVMLTLFYNFEARKWYFVNPEVFYHATFISVMWLVLAACVHDI